MNHGSVIGNVVIKSRCSYKCCSHIKQKVCLTVLHRVNSTAAPWTDISHWFSPWKFPQGIAFRNCQAVWATTKSSSTWVRCYSTWTVWPPCRDFSIPPQRHRTPFRALLSGDCGDCEPGSAPGLGICRFVTGWQVFNCMISLSTRW